METLRNRTVADLVTENIKTAHIFKKHGIDFCCGGGISIEEACRKKNLDLTEIEEELVNVNGSTDRNLDYNKWKIDFLTDHIVNVHHSYVEESIPLLLQYTARVSKVHGERHPEVVEIENLFHRVARELASHMKKEELILFPFIKKMISAKEEERELQRPAFGTAENPIKMMEDEHETAGDLLAKIAELSNNYTPPEGACNTYRAMYAKLDEFETDLHLHVHLENNILFPKALKLEKELFN
ncbi:iron-sulfur cluster repair di-iron protein [Salegentibacter chungangensis]|uniref:Iron-sulfur cluster repair di-iron protein n=1 Tax=Salegentibacter chungangensis TaxID=1335724 RepID=A0ABW3NWV6_9FLAO